MSKNNSHITFYVFRKDGSRNPDIIRSFLEERLISPIDAAEGKIKQIDNTFWNLILEEEVEQKLKQSAEPVKCIVSFQLRRSGSFAIARLWKEKPREKTA